MSDELWKGQFGDEYTKRNVGRVVDNTAFFARALAKISSDIERVIELGCGSGENLSALRRLIPDSYLLGVEINQQAAMMCKDADFVFRQSIFDFRPPEETNADLAFTKGVLIHISPKDLPIALKKLYESSDHYILIAEYYNPVPIEVPYRGEMGRMWKRDFASEMLGLYPSLRVIDYGFVWRFDRWPQDDLTWFLMEKR